MDIISPTWLLCTRVSLNIPRHYCDSYVGFTGVECKNASFVRVISVRVSGEIFGLTASNKQSKVSAITWSSCYQSKLVLPQITQLHTHIREDNVQLLGITPIWFIDLIISVDHYVYDQQWSCNRNCLGQLLLPQTGFMKFNGYFFLEFYSRSYVEGNFVNKLSN